MSAPDRRYTDRDASFRPSWSANPGSLGSEHDRIFEETKDLPGWQAEADSRKLYEMAYFAGDAILEIGTYGGRASVVELRGALASPARREAPQLFGIDIDENSIVRTYETLVGEGLADHALLFKGTLQEFVTRYDVRPTMAFLDGDHRYDGVKADLDTLTAMLAPRVPVFCHDYLNPENETGEYGVRKAVDAWVEAGFAERLGFFGCGTLVLTSERCTGKGRALPAPDFRAERERLLSPVLAGERSGELFTGLTESRVLPVRIGDGSFGRESYENGGRRWRVQWVAPTARLELPRRVPPGRCRIRIALATIAGPRHLELFVDGVSAGPPVRVSRVLWENGYDEIAFDVTVSGRPVLEFRSGEPAFELPDGRRVGFLVISSPIVHALDAA